MVVLEAAGYFNESDFNQLELQAYQEMFWRGGPTPTADGNVSLVAGTTLGGGTDDQLDQLPAHQRPGCASSGRASTGSRASTAEDFDRHLDAVLERIGANDQCSDLNGPQQRMKEGAEALGWSFATIVRNTDRRRYSPEMAGLPRLRRPVRGKQSRDRTWLADAAGARRAVPHGTPRERVLVEDGRAAGVEAVWTAADDRTARGSRCARRGWSSPAARSSRRRCCCAPGIGGPGGRRLPAPAPASSVVGGAYGTDQQAWWGAPQAGSATSSPTPRTATAS